MSMEATLDLGDYVDDYTKLNFFFTTLRDDTGVPITFAGSPVISVYKGSATGTEKDSGEAYITLDIDFDSKTGLNHVLINLATDAFFVIGEDYSIVITTGTVNGVSKVGVVLAHFSIENRFMRGTNSAATAAVLGSAVGADISADIAANQTTNDAIEVAVITNAAGTDIAGDIIAMKIDTAATLIDTAVIGALGAGLTDLGGMSTAMKAEVNAEVVDTLTTDTYAEPGQETPAATSSIQSKISYVFKMTRNRKTVSGTTFQLFNDDAATVDQKATVADSGSVGSITEIESGP